MNEMHESTPGEEAIFQAALDHPTPEARRAYVAGACAGNPELHDRVQRLLAVHAESHGPLDALPPGLRETEIASRVAQPGEMIGPYKLLQQIGEGGMGAVFMAEQTEPVKRRVAVKIIRPGMDSRMVIARFEAERQALALMDHPHIAKVLDAGTTHAGLPYFVMELVKGMPLTQYCDEKRLTPRERLALFIPVCQAVQHAHQKGIIHRDLKPSNVLVALYDGRPVPKVIDFGVAKATGSSLTERTLFTGFGEIVGTLEYMSPEQAELNQLDIDTRSDVYSLGVLLYELLTGSTPFEKQSLKNAAFIEVLRIIREDEPPKPSTRLTTAAERASIASNRGLDPDKLAGAVRGDLDWIVMRALEKDRNRRYESASSLCHDIERHLSDEPVLARPPSLAYRLQKFARRNRPAVATTAALVFLLFAAVVGTTKGYLRARSAEMLARDEANRARAAENEAADRAAQAQHERDAAKMATEQALLAQQHATESARQQLLAQRHATQSAEEVRQSARQLDSLRLAAHATAVLAEDPGQSLLLAMAGADRAVERTAAHNNPLLAALRDLHELKTWTAPAFPVPPGATGHTRLRLALITPDGKRAIVSGHRDVDPQPLEFPADSTDAAWVYDLVTGQPIASFWMPGMLPATLDISPDGTLAAAAFDAAAVCRYEDGSAAGFSERAIRIFEMATGREVRVLKGHTDAVVSVQFDATGKRLISGSWDQTARIWDVDTGTTVTTLQLESDQFKSLSLAQLSRDGSRAITVSSGGYWQGADVAAIIRQQGVRDQLSPDDVELDPSVTAPRPLRWINHIHGRSAQGGHGGNVRLWDTATGKLVAELDHTERQVFPEMAAGFTPDGSCVITARGNDVHLWNSQDGHREQTAAVGTGPLAFQARHEGRTWLALSDAPQVLVWQSDGEAGFWERSRAFLRSNLRRTGHIEAPPVILASSTSGEPRIAVEAAGGPVVKRVIDGQVIAVLKGHSPSAPPTSFSPDGTQLVTTGGDSTLRLWTTAEPRLAEFVFAGDSAEPVGRAQFADSGNLVVVAPPNDHWDEFAGERLGCWNIRTGQRTPLAINETTRAVDPRQKDLLGRLIDFHVSSDGTRLVTVHNDLNPRRARDAAPVASDLYTPVRLWDVHTGKLLFVLHGLSRSATTARFSPDGAQLLLFSNGEDNFALVDDNDVVHGTSRGGMRQTRIDIWDARTGALQRTILPAAPGGGLFAEWTPDGKRIVTDVQCPSNSARIYDAATGALDCELAAGVRSADAVVQSTDGLWIASYRRRILVEQSQVEIWDAASGELRSKLTGHAGVVTSACFSPDQQTLLTTSTDHTARLWNIADGTLRATLRGHQQAVTAGDFSPDGQWVATISQDGTARIWNAATAAEWLTIPVGSVHQLGTIAFHPDSRRILTAVGGAAQLYPIDPLPQARHAAPRTPTAAEIEQFQIP
jgi:WD40 repeat protein/serine/threonine protein kinase